MLNPNVYPFLYRNSTQQVYLSYQVLPHCRLSGTCRATNLHHHICLGQKWWGTNGGNHPPLMVTKWILEKQQNNECTGIWCDGQMVSNDHNIYIYISYDNLNMIFIFLFNSICFPDVLGTKKITWFGTSQESDTWVNGAQLELDIVPNYPTCNGVIINMLKPTYEVGVSHQVGSKNRVYIHELEPWWSRSKFWDCLNPLFHGEATPVAGFTVSPCKK